MRGGRIHLLVATAFASLALGGAYAAVSSPTSGASRETPVHQPHEALRLSGHVAGLYPGRYRRLRVLIRNRSPRPLVVTSIDVAVVAASSRCRARDLQAPPFSGRLRVPGHARRRATLTIKLRARASDACQRARFPLRFAATARRRP
jgi:hypothetical protein